MLTSEAVPANQDDNNDSAQLEKLLNDQYKQQLIELAQKDIYLIPVLLDEHKQHQNNNWDYKQYKRHKITVTDYEKAKQINVEYDQIPDDDVAVLDDNDRDNAQVKRLDKVMELYQFLAMCYLKMPPDEFKRADWGVIRQVLDACQYRTGHSLADLSRGLYEFFHLDITSHLTSSDYEIVRMYRLWTGKAKTKPWEYNGGFIYEEDLNTLLKMEELQISGENYKAKKAQARQSLGLGGDNNDASTVGQDGVIHRKTTRFKRR